MRQRCLRIFIRERGQNKNTAGRESETGVKKEFLRNRITQGHDPWKREDVDEEQSIVASNLIKWGTEQRIQIRILGDKSPFMHACEYWDQFR